MNVTSISYVIMSTLQILNKTTTKGLYIDL